MTNEDSEMKNKSGVKTFSAHSQFNGSESPDHENKTVTVQIEFSNMEETKIYYRYSTLWHQQGKGIAIVMAKVNVILLICKKNFGKKI
jgi:hypothetical protein